MKNIDKAFKKHQKDLSAAMDDLLDIMGYAHEGFMKHSMKSIGKIDAIAKKIHKFEEDFDEEVVKETDKQLSMALVALAGHIERIGDCMEIVTKTITAKIKEGTLFSDKAVHELDHIFKTSMEILRSVKDALITMNPILIGHALVTSEQLSRMAQESSTHHEERLVSGVCRPRHSSIFLDLVDNLRISVWHLKEMAIKLRDLGA